MMTKIISELYEAIPIIEVDDYIAGFMMVSAISGAAPELKAQYLAQWAARLREHYVEIGRSLGPASHEFCAAGPCTADDCKSAGHCLGH